MIAGWPTFHEQCLALVFDYRSRDLTALDLPLINLLKLVSLVCDQLVEEVLAKCTLLVRVVPFKLIGLRWRTPRLTQNLQVLWRSHVNDAEQSS